MDVTEYGKLWNAVPEEAPGTLREELADIIGSLSRLFFSTYYVNLENDTYRAVTQLRRIGDVLGDEVNCSAAMKLYAQHFVHPDDQTGFLQVMNVENLRRTLRWWQPTVAAEYRTQGDEPGSWSWVRATAVLARTGTDELPLTAVYVAQDISGGRHLPDM